MRSSQEEWCSVSSHSILELLIISEENVCRVCMDTHMCMCVRHIPEVQCLKVNW